MLSQRKTPGPDGIIGEFPSQKHRDNTNPFLALKNFQKIELDSILPSSFYETDIKPDKVTL